MEKPLIDPDALARLQIALDKLELPTQLRVEVDAGVAALVHGFLKVAEPIAELLGQPRSKKIDVELSSRFEAIAKSIQAPKRPEKFRFVLGGGIDIPGDFGLPQLRLPCAGLVRPRFPGPIFEWFLERAAPSFDQDILWGGLQVSLGLQAGLADVYESVALGNRVLAGDQQALEPMRAFVKSSFGGQPRSYTPVPPFGPSGIPAPGAWDHGALPCIRPEIEENVPEILERFCPPWGGSADARNLTTPARDNAACEGDLLEITAVFGPTEWVEVMFPYQPPTAQFLPREDDGTPLHPTLTQLSDDEIGPSDRYRYVVTRIDRDVRVDGAPALTDTTLRVAVPPSLRRNEPGPHDVGVVHGDRIRTVLRRPCPTNPSGDLQLKNVRIDYIPAPHVVSVIGEVIGCRPTATLRWRTQGVTALQMRLVDGDDWTDVSPPHVGDAVFSVAGMFTTGPRHLRWQARGDGTCEALALREGQVAVLYELEAEFRQTSIPVRGTTTLEIRRPACVTDPREDWVVTLSSEGRGIVGHPGEVTIPAGASATTVEIVGEETGDTYITLSGPHIVEQRVVIDVNHDVRPIPDAVVAARCADLEAYRDDNFVNWHHNVIRRGVRHAWPPTVERLVDAVRTADVNGWKVGTPGSGWSYTRCAVGEDTEVVISTDNLRGELHDVWRRTVVRRNPDVPAEHLVHVKAGTKIYELNCLLAHEKSPPLMLPTMGGSNGQSIAGVIGTSVHGSHFRRPPVADAIRAIHLVANDGREWWIEPTTDSITNPARMADVRDSGQLCPSTNIVYDDRLFNAVLVSLGAAGVMYSLVVACEPNRNIATRTVETTWTQAQLDIAEMIVGDRPPSLGRAPVDFLELIIDPNTRTGRKTIRAYTTEDRTPVPPPSPDGSDDVIDFATRALLLALAIDPVTVIGVAGATVVLATSTVFGGLMIAVSEWIHRKSLEALVNPTVVAELIEVTADFNELMFDLAFRPFSLEGLAAAAPNLINLIWKLGIAVASGAAAVAELQRFMISTLRPETTASGGYTVARNDEVLTSQVRVTDPTTGVITCEGNQHGPFERLIASYEYVVPISRLDDFMEGFEREGRHVPGLFEIYDGLRGGNDAFVATYNFRFTGRTRATLGIQRFPINAHVEIYTVSGLRGNGRFRQRLFHLVRQIGAVPHMGQLHEIGARIPEVFGPSLPNWREQISRIADESGGRRNLFWSGFHAQSQLLP